MAKTEGYKGRPTLPWWQDPEIIGRADNAFETFDTPAAVMAYFSTELPEATAELLAGILDAGASAESLLRDFIELFEMGHVELAEQLSLMSENIERKDMCDTDFLPASMKKADEIILKAVAAITRLKVRERLEGVPVQLRDDPSARDVESDKYDLHRIFPLSAALLEELGE